MNINSTFNISRMKEKSREFWLTLFLNPLFLLIVIVYVAGKMTTNLVMGASLVNALRSSIMGFIIYTLGCYLMHLISNVNQELEEANEIKGEKGFIVWIIGWLVVAQFLLSINVMNTYDVINFRIPLWGQLTETWLSFIERVSESNDYIDGMGLVGIPNLILYVLIPSIILWKCRFKFPKFFGLKTSLAAIPFVAIYLLSFIVIKGISLASLLTLLFVLMWPALGEEFFYRGIVQRALMKVTSKPVSAIAMMSLLFTVSHAPVYFLGYYEEPIIALSRLLPILLVSFFWGYGYYKTRVLWPWILIHAISNLVGF